MGYPIRSNIFATRNNNEKDYYGKFPIQVAVLFSSAHPDFRDGFSDIFAHLDQITGDHVVFFAVLDPPQDWIDQARQQGRDVNNFKPLGVSFDDKPLVNELARLFQLQWAELPALVVSNDLWSTDFVTTSTTIDEVEKQLQALVMLARRSQDEVSLREIYDALVPVSTGSVLMQRNFNHNLRTDLFHFYNVLDAVDPHMLANPNPFRSNQFRVSANYLRSQSNEALFQLRSLSPRRRDTDFGEEDEDATGVDENLQISLMSQAAGYLTAPASVVSRANLRTQVRDEYLSTIPLEALEAESQSSIEQSLSITQLFKVSDSDQRQRRPTDYTPALIGIWKALELETNYSIIQAARKSRGAKMPDYFTKYQPKLTINVRTGRRQHNLNQKDNQIPDRHRFMTLGDSWHITKTMLSSAQETLSREVGRVPSDNHFFDPWEELYRSRNNGAHTNMMTSRDLEQVFRSAEAFDWSFLTQLKNTLR